MKKIWRSMLTVVVALALGFGLFALYWWVIGPWFASRLFAFMQQ